MFSNLHAVLEDVTGASPSDEGIRRIVTRAQRYGIAYLRRRARAGRLDASVFGLTLDDLALDCVADLFRRDDDGRFDRIEGYFQGIGWREMDAAGVEMALRRLVLSIVNEGLFRRYQEWDPTLGRIIRNFKRHLGQSADLELHREHFSLVVRVKGRPDGRELPTMPPEVLEAQLHHVMPEAGSLPELLEVLPDVLSLNGFYAAEVGLTDLALAYRSVLERLHDDEGEEAPAADRPVVRADLADAVRTHLGECLEEVDADMRERYVDQRGIAPSLYAAYLATVHDALASQYVDATAEKASLRVFLCRYIGEVASPVYRKQHQAVVEYLVKLTQERLMRRAVHLV